MKTFHGLSIVSKENEARDALRIALHVPDELKQEFEFQPGQHLPVQFEKDGKKMRRTYSICNAQGTWPLEIGIRIQPNGQFSGYAANELSVGDALQAMPPAGRFCVDPDTDNSRFCVFVAAGSGITPILSIITSLLHREPHSRCALFYGNRKKSTTMFIEELYALKNLYPDRLQLHFVFSQEEQELALAAGRIDGARIKTLCEQLLHGVTVDEAYICGPDTMIESVSDAFAELGLAAENVHSERFGVPRKPLSRRADVAPGDTDSCAVTVILDGHKYAFDMPRDGARIVDAAAEHGVELPYSCKGGVCATCRTHVREGRVTMDTNYGLEPWEVEQGFVLACQSHPDSDTILLDYDKA